MRPAVLPNVEDPSLGEDGLPRLFAYPASPAQLLHATGSGLRRRHSANLFAHREVLIGLGYLMQLEHPTFQESPAALFELIHSPFEYALHLLTRTGIADDPETAHVTHHIDRIIERAEQAAQRGLEVSPASGLYEILPGSASSSFFPAPGIHEPLTAGPLYQRYRALIHAAKELIASWDADLVEEIDFFIRDYALTDGEFYGLPYLSVDGVPGHVRLAPLLLLGLEGYRYEPGAPIEIALTAAQIVHESRHQKGFFFNRVSDPRPNLYPSGFVQAEWHRETLPAPFHRHVWQELFDLLLSLSYELSFLRFLEQYRPLGTWEAAWAKKIQNKRTFVLTLVLEAERNRARLTPLGLCTLNALLAFLESPQT